MVVAERAADDAGIPINQGSSAMSPICVPALPLSRLTSHLSCERADAPDDANDLDAPRSCGWFDSSYELVQGTWVTEHCDFDGLSSDVPLSWQLAACS
jgi:hypothetical protein